jgi:hypothetical protein
MLFIMRVTDLYTWRKNGYNDKNNWKRKMEIIQMHVSEMTCHLHYDLTWDSDISKRAKGNYRFDMPPYQMAHLMTKLSLWAKCTGDLNVKKFKKDIL